MSDVIAQEVGSPEYYVTMMAQYDKEFDTWKQRCEKILKMYKDAKRNERMADSRFNILWSNVQTLKASTFSRLPRPDVSRRFKDNDPVGRVASLILERALAFEVDNYPDFHDSIKHAVYDRFLGGRGTAWVRYEPKLRQVPMEEGEQISDEVGETEQFREELDYECAPTDYVDWRDFGHNVARTWGEVCVVWRKVYMTREALVERFGEEEGGRVPLDASPELNIDKANPDGAGKRGLVIEIWDKDLGQAKWLSKTLARFLDERDDPLGLEEFFPCPRSLYGTVTNDSLVPTPDYVLYQDQAKQLNILASRIDGLVKALQVRGVYDASEPTLARLFTEGSNTMLLPVKNWAAFAEKQGLSGALDIVDLQPIAMALHEAYQAFDELKGQIYEITGIADIIRGDTNANETAAAQQIKGQYANLRLKQYQDEVALFASHLLQMKAEIICGHFDTDTILKMASASQLMQADQSYIPAAMEMLRDRPTRTFRIQVAADSMVYLNEDQEKQDRLEFLSSTSSFIEKLVQAGQAAPQVLSLGVELLKFGVTGFRVGKTMEGFIDEVADQLRQQAQQPQQPKPDPEMMKIQAQGQLDQQKAQLDAQAAQQKAQLDAQADQARAQADIAVQNTKIQADAQLEAMRQHEETQREQLRLTAEQQNKWRIAVLDASTKIIAAGIAAGDETTPGMSLNDAMTTFHGLVAQLSGPIANPTIQ